MMPVKQLKAVNLHGRVGDRLNDGVYQVNAVEILIKMRKHMKRDAFCCAGITMSDLYPRDEWNFVFGLASQTSNCGVYSLARYLSNLGNNETTVIDIER